MRSVAVVAAVRAGLRSTVIRAADAVPADAADRGHALGKGGVVARQGTAGGAAAILGAPGIVVGRLGEAGRSGAYDGHKKGEGTEDLPHRWLLGVGCLFKQVPIGSVPAAKMFKQILPDKHGT